MIIYQATKTQFLHHALRDDIEDVVSRHFRIATGRGVGPSEINSWKHSLLEMAKVLQDEEIPAEVGVAIEYQLPQTSKRIDFVITGEDAAARSKVIIVELKQWSESRRSEKDGIVWARRGGRSGEVEGTHPSYQAWSYAAYLEDFNAAVQDGAMSVQPCTYLHNHPRDGEIDHPHYRDHLARAPLFLARERAKLQAFIREHVRHGDRKGALYAIENGRIRPSKMLMDSVAGLLQGKAEFVLIDDQKVVHETILQVDARATRRKQVVIVQGGPGTGKSVIAINLLGAFIARASETRATSPRTRRLVPCTRPSWPAHSRRRASATCSAALARSWISRPTPMTLSSSTRRIDSTRRAVSIATSATTRSRRWPLQIAPPVAIQTPQAGHTRGRRLAVVDLHLLAGREVQAVELLELALA